MNSLGRWPWRRVLVRGSSMLPVLRDRDVVVVRARARPSPGDVVLVQWASRPAQLSLKRVVRSDGRGWHVVGDNGGASTDSRELGPATVLGVVRWRFWPRPGRVQGVSRSGGHNR